MKLIDSFKEEEWIKGVSRNMSPFFDYLSGTGIYKYSKDFGVDASIERIAIGKAMHQNMFFNKKSLGVCSERVVKAALEKKNFLRNLEEIHKKRALELIKVSEKIAKVKKIEAKIFSQYCLAWQRLAPGLWITMLLGRVFGKRLTEDLIGRLRKSREKIEEMISILTYPDEPTPMKEEEIELLKLGANIQKEKDLSRAFASKDTSQKIKKIYEKYKYIPVNYVNEPWELKFFTDELRKMVENFDCGQKLKNLEKAYNENIRKRSALEKELSLSIEEKLEIEILRKVTFLNEFRKFVFCQANYLIRPFLSSLAKNIGQSSWEDVSYLSSDEILELIRAEKVEENKEKISERKNLYVFTRTDQGEFIIFSGFDAQELAQKFLAEEPAREIKKVEVLKGVIACKGRTVGPAKIVLRTEDVSKVNNGDILIAKMTSVDFIPAMRLASGFVTDEGGISCHAAIVAREMNKPCLIATGRATEVFHDNEEVEVDAENGWVKKK